MLIRFQNLGKIKDTTLDLRPLTVIIGPNNSNKTYIAYSLYGLWRTGRYDSALLNSAPLNAVVERAFQAAKDNTFNIPIDQELLKCLQMHSEQVCTQFKDELPQYYQDSSGKLFSTTHFNLEITLDDFITLLARIARVTPAQSGDWKFQFSYKDSSVVIEYQRVGQTLEHETEPVSSGKSRTDFLFSTTVLLGLFISDLLFPRSFLLPAERNAFIITYKMLANRRYKALRAGLRQSLGRVNRHKDLDQQLGLLRDAEEVRYPQPVEDFLDFLTDVEAAKPPNTRSPFAKLADTIESSIQNANKTRYRSTALGGKEIITQVEKGLDIDLYNASSSIKQLAPLLLYLRYRAKENDLLIIDEPEMNLHPESQAKLLEVLAMLVNHGVNVLLTTHSPYLMAHLNNLAQTGDTSQAVRNRQAKSLYLKHPDSLLRMDQVSAYEMRDNQLHSLKDEDYGIRWDTLSDVSADLQQRYFAIYEEGHAKERARNGRKATTPKAGQSAGGQAGADQP